jgi:hypothetical protein
LVKLGDIKVIRGPLGDQHAVDPRHMEQAECVRRLQIQAFARFSWRKADISTTGLRGLEPARAAIDEGKGWAAIPQDLTKWNGRVHIVDSLVFQFMQDRALSGAKIAVASGGENLTAGCYHHFTTGIGSGGLGYAVLGKKQNGMLLLRRPDGTHELLMLVIRLEEEEIRAFRGLVDTLYTDGWEAGGEEFELQAQVSKAEGVYPAVKRGSYKVALNSGAGGGTHVQYGLRAMVANMRFQEDNFLTPGPGHQSSQLPAKYNPAGDAETALARDAWRAHTRALEELERRWVPGDLKRQRVNEIHPSALDLVGAPGTGTSSLSTTCGHAITTHIDQGAGPESVMSGKSTSSPLATALTCHPHIQQGTSHQKTARARTTYPMSKIGRNITGASNARAWSWFW